MKYKPPNFEIWIEKVKESDKAYQDKKDFEHQRFIDKQEARKSLKGKDYANWLEADGY